LALTAEKVEAALAQEGTIRGAARVLERDPSGLRRWMRRHGIEAPEPKQQAERVKALPVTTTVKGDDAVLVSNPSADVGHLGDLIRSRGLKPADWVVVSTTINEWEALAHGGGANGEPRTVTLKQLKVTLKRRPTVELVSQARHVPALVKSKRRPRKAGRAELIVVEGDHQIPYHDPDLDNAATQFVADLQPVEHIFLGDTADFPTISRHDDHPAAMASAQECLDEAYAMLRRRAQAAPDARRRKLKGNHDWRLESELLKRAERVYGITPAGEDTPALSLRRLLHLDQLGIELVEDVRGWQHAEIELVPGRGGLVVRHGFVTGHNTAKRTLAKLGRSVIVGHDHGKESAFHLAYPDRLLLQAHVIGGMFRNDEVWPHFAVQPNWHPGFVTVTRWPNDGRFIVDHALWQDGHLYWRDRRW
jgi:hypothetical protein